MPIPLRGGLGDDILAISDLAFQRVDGGAGTDTLRLDGTGLALDLTAIGNEALQDIEVVDLTGSGDNSLTVNANEVFNLSGNANTLRVTGDSGDALNLVGSWTNTGTTDIGGVTHDVYSTGNATIQVEQDVTTSVAALPSFSIDDAFVNESSGSATFTVTRSGNTALLSSVDFATADSTATAGSDYAAATGTLSFTAGETTKTISVSVTPDSNVEADEFYFVNLSNASEATIADSQGLGTITTAPELTIGDVTVAENAGTVTFTVTRTGDTTANNTATAGSDFTATSGTVSFAVGQTTASIVVTITNDSIFGNTETFFVNLSSPVAATLGDSQGQGTITDSDAGILLSGLDGTTGFRIDGPDANDRAGGSVSSAGDVNGDGFEDLIIGAIYGGSAGAEAGEAYVVFGAASFGTNLSLPTSGTNGFRLDGIDAGDRNGYSVSGAGDVNGDGFADLIIGATRGTPNGSSSGESYVVFGGSNVGSSTSVDLSALDGSDGFRIDGLFASLSAYSVSGAGDVNGDGFADVIVGAARADANGNSSGESYVVFGKASGFAANIALSSLDGTTGFRIQGIEALDYSGRVVSGAGDVNGDGIDDLIISSPEENLGSDPGEAYVVFGNASGFDATLDLGDLDGTNGFQLNGIDNSDRTGFSISAAGDVNGDGIGDLIIGAPFADPNGLSSGESYVVFGTSSGFATTLALSSLGGTTGFRIDGVSSGDSSGRSVSGAGDVNGDGFDDLLIGAYGSDVTASGAGVTYLVFGKASGFGTSLALSSLDGTSGLRFDGISQNDNSGKSVSGAGDVNGDGFEDVIIGVDIRPFFSSSGGAYVVFGGPSFGASLDLSTLDGTTGFRINKVGDYDGVAQSVGGAGDVNGDGLADIVIGSPDAYPAGSSSGATYVVFGAATFSSTLDLSTLDGTNGFVLNGVTSFDDSGQSVGIGDVNGDGYDDVIVGAPDGDATASNAGETYVVFGKASSFAATIELSSLNGSTGFRIDGVSDSDDSGYGVSAAGDINGDGIDDLIIGAPRGDAIASNAGETYVVFGKTSGFGSTLALSSLDETTGFRVDGIGISDLSGITVSAGGDINGDGIGDLIIGAPYADTNDVNSGATYVVFGGSAVGSGGSLQLSALNGSDGFVLNGTDNIDNAGRAVSSAGDLNGDGYDDLLIGAPYGDGAATNGGEAYVVFGKASGFTASLELSALDGTDGFRLDGVSGSDLAGRAASVAGDVNGDGFDDLIIGALYGDAGGSNSGESYVVFGGVFGGSVDFLGTTGADTLSAGTSAAETFVAGRGNDTLTGGGGADVLRGGEGDDILGVSDATFLRIDGGTDASGGVGDTLRFDGTNLAIDLTAIKDLKVQNIERIDMTGAGTNSLTLSLSDVLNISETSNTLTLLGGTGESDAVTVSDGEWTNDTSGVNF